MGFNVAFCPLRYKVWELFKVLRVELVSGHFTIGSKPESRNSIYLYKDFVPFKTVIYITLEL